MPDQPPVSSTRPELADIPPALLAHDTGMTRERMRELFAYDDAYTPRPEPGGTDDTQR